jgi:hypothetical protein
MSSYIRWSDIRAKHVEQAGGEEAVAAGKQELLAEVVPAGKCQTTQNSLPSGSAITT